MSGWDGSRKRKRSPGQGYDDPAKALIFDETKLTLEDGKTVDCQYSFSRQACPSVVSKLSGLTDHPQQEPVRLFSCPRPVGALWIKSMLTKGQELVEKCQELTKKYRTDDRYSVDSFHLEFHLGRRQLARSSHSHIVMPIHAYYQYRLRHFKALRASSSISSDVRSGLFFEHWPRYYDNRKRYLEDTKSKHRLYQREDEEAITRLLRSVESRSEKKPVEKSDTKSTEENKDADKTGEAGTSESQVNGESSAEKTGGAAAPSEESKPEESAGETKEKEEPMEVTTQSESAAVPAAGESSEGKSEEAPMEVDASSATKEGDEASKETKTEPAEELKKENKAEIALSTAQRKTIEGVTVEYIFDDGEQGNPCVTIEFVDIPSLSNATQSQLESVITVLNKLCDEWRFTLICSVFVTTSNRIRLVVDVSSFIRHFSTADVKTWAERWRATPTEFASPTARATHENLEALDKNEPGSLVLEDWSYY